jgi:hypothetical protein
VNIGALIERIGAAIIDPRHIAFRDTDALQHYGKSSHDVSQTVIGASREGMPLFGWTFGDGPEHVSIVAGSHADEPTGPMTAQALPILLAQYFPELLARYRFFVVPQMNPDGAERNRAWFANPPNFSAYIAHAVRELPGDDIEFGFADEEGARPENRAVVRWLSDKGPFAAHFSLHGMGWAEGAWFLLCAEWADRAGPLLDALTGMCAREEFPLHDIDRKGQKGFTRLREGVATTPTATAMRNFFVSQGDPSMAGLFRPSSMELAASLGGDPLCMVSEMPLFLLHGESSLDDPILLRFRDDLAKARAEGTIETLRERYGITAVPLEMQMRYQLGMIALALHFRAG